jgi:hypothetical protein
LITHKERGKLGFTEDWRSRTLAYIHDSETPVLALIELDDQGTRAEDIKESEYVQVKTTRPEDIGSRDTRNIW